MKLIKSDYVIIAAILFFFSCHMITNYVVNKNIEAAEQVGISKEIALMVEANPIAKLMFRTEMLRLIYGYIVMPGIIGGVYYMQRRKYKNDDDDRLMTFAITLLLVSIFNFMNDFSVLLGVLA